MASSPAMTVQIRPFEAPQVAHVEPKPDQDVRKKMSKLTQGRFRALRIAMIVLSAFVLAFTVTTMTMDGVIVSNPYKYVGRESPPGWTYEDPLEDTIYHQITLRIFFGISLAFGAYNVVTFLVYFIITIAAPEQTLAMPCSSATCLLVTIMIGFAMSLYTAIVYCLKFTHKFQPPPAVAIISSTLIFAHCVMQFVSTCCFICVGEVLVY